MNTPNFEDSGQTRLGGVVKYENIPFLGGRPEREKIIRQDDVLNFTILLHTTQDTEDFINNL